MACEFFRGPKGEFQAVVCSRGPRAKRKKCSEKDCGDGADYQCDHPIKPRGKRNTCDRWICEEHRTRCAQDIDWCPFHAKPETWVHSAPHEVINPATGVVIAVLPLGHPMLDFARRAGMDVEVAIP